MLAQQHTQTANEFLQAADREFANGDTLQASEKMWGAASHAIMAIAQRRGWPHGTHRSLSQAVQRIARELDDLEMRGMFSMAEQFHANFYHGHLEGFQVEDYREEVRLFINRLTALAG